jgi:undecaprenyl-diphosphatase
MTWGRWRRVTVSRPPRPLLTPGARPALLVIIALCLIDVAALGVRYAGHRYAGPFDLSVDDWFKSRLGQTSPVLTALTWLGDAGEVTLITALIVLVCARARWWRGVALAALTVPAASVLTEGILKPLIGRTIGGALSLPSGHTTAAFAMATVAAVLLSRRGRRGRLLTVAAYVLATAVAVAMVAQGFHYFTDTVAGVGVGVGTVLIGAFVIDAVAGRLRTATAGPPGPNSFVQAITPNEGIHHAQVQTSGRRGGRNGPAAGPTGRDHSSFGQH